MAITGLLDKCVQLSQLARGGLSPAADGPCSFVSRSHSVTSRPSGYLPLGGPALGSVTGSARKRRGPCSTCSASTGRYRDRS